MVEVTPFAGLDALDPGEPLATDNYKFQLLDRYIIDRILKIGAITHRHDAHAAMVNPTAAPTVTVGTTGGSIPAAQPLSVAYTLIDQDGGESLPVTPVTITTAVGYVDPLDDLTAVVGYTAGSLLADNYSYAATVSDGRGGETAISPAVLVTIMSGYANANVTLSGLTALTDDASGSDTLAEWRLWRQQGGGPWYLIGTGGASADTYVDNGSPGDCTVQPPAVGTTKGANTLSVTVPSAGQPTGVVNFNIYVSVDGSFSSPALLATLTPTAYNVAQVYTDLTVVNGQPPTVSTCLPGANLITSSDLALNWLAPVANVAALPTTGNHTGDARVALDGPTIHVWTGSAWTAISGGGGGGGGGDTSALGAVQLVGPTNTAIAASTTTTVTIPGPTSPEWLEAYNYRIVVGISLAHSNPSQLTVNLTDHDGYTANLLTAGADITSGADNMGSGPPFNDPDQYVYFSDMAKSRFSLSNDTWNANLPLGSAGTQYVSPASGNTQAYRPHGSPHSLVYLEGDSVGSMTLSIVNTGSIAGTLYGVVVWLVSSAWDALQVLPPPPALGMQYIYNTPGTSYTVTPQDVGAVVYLDNGASACTVTIPSTIPVNSRGKVFQHGTGTVSFAGSAVSIVGKGSKQMTVQYTMAEWWVYSSGLCLITGDIS
jgi:hypothetical protein